MNKAIRILSTHWRPLMFSCIGASLPIIAVMAAMHERFIHVEMIQIELKEDFKTHISEPSHQGTRDWALSEKRFREWTDGWKALEDEKNKTINRRLNIIEKNQLEIIKATK